MRGSWTRQWAAIGGTVTPQAFSTEPDGRIDVTVHQVVRNLDGELLEDTTVHHVYRLRGDRVDHMQLMGRANWWMPRWLDRVLPRLGAEAPADAGAR